MDKIFDVFLFESDRYKDVTSDKAQKGVLRTIKGPLAEWDSKNRNNRIYSEKVWDKVVESDYFKEQTKYKTLYGEANHPTDRFEVDFARVSHSITEMHKVPDKKEVHGTIDILDTPLGNILNVLYEYGSIPGFSSRAGGTLTNKKDHVVVDEDTYHFITFDAVPFPSVVSARPLPIGEGFDNSEKYPLSEEAKSKISDIIRMSSKKDRDMLKSFIYELQEDANFDFSDEIAIFEGLEDTEDKGPVKEATLHLLKDSYRIASGLTEERNKLLEEVERLKSGIEDKNRELEDVSALKSRIAELAGENLSFKSVIEQQLAEVSSLKNTISEREEHDDDLDFLKAENQYLNERNDKLERFYKEFKTSRSNDTDKLVNEIVQLKESVGSLEEEKSRLEDALEVYDDRILFRDKEVKNLESVVEDFQSQLNNLDERLRLKEDRLKAMTDSYQEAQGIIESLNGSFSDVSEEQKIMEETLSLDNRELQSEIERLKKEKRVAVKTLNEQVGYYQHSLVDSVCRSYGISPDSVTELLGDDFTIDIVYEACEKIASSVKRNSSPFVLVGIDKQESNDDSNDNRLNDVFSNSRRR